MSSETTSFPVDTESSLSDSNQGATDSGESSHTDMAANQSFQTPSGSGQASQASNNSASGASNGPPEDDDGSDPELPPTTPTLSDGAVDKTGSPAKTTGLIVLFDGSGRKQRLFMAFDLVVRPEDMSAPAGDSSIFTHIELKSFQIAVPKTQFGGKYELPILCLRRVQVKMGPIKKAENGVPLPEGYDEQWQVLSQFPLKSSYRTESTTITTEKSVTAKATMWPAIEASKTKGKSVQKSPFEIQIDIDKSTIYCDQRALWNYELSSDCKDVEHDLQMGSHRGVSLVHVHCLPTSIDASILASFEVTEAGSKTFFRPERVCGIPVGFRHIKTRLQTKVMWDPEEGAKFPGEKSARGGVSRFLRQQFRGGCGSLYQPDQDTFDAPGIKVTLALVDLVDDEEANADKSKIQNSIRVKKWRRRFASFWSVRI